MSGYYKLNISEINQERIGEEKKLSHYQKRVFKALDSEFKYPIAEYKGILLILNTGRGKTSTSVKWVCSNILSKGIKVLWLVHSSYLISQAVHTFTKEIHHVNGRETINLRVVFSEKDLNSNRLETTDDLLFCTPTTAWSTCDKAKLDSAGTLVLTPFQCFIDSCKGGPLFVVVDEAQHSFSEECNALLASLRECLPNLYVLGLTASINESNLPKEFWSSDIYMPWISFSPQKCY